MLTMTIYLDDDPTDLAGPDLGSVLDAASQRLTNTGRIVVQVHVDGHPLQSNQIEQKISDPMGDTDVHLYSADTTQLALSTLQDTRTQLAQTQTQMIDAAQALNQDDPPKAMKLLSHIIVAWQQTQQAVTHSASLLSIQLDDLVIDDQPFNTIANALIQQLKTVRQMITVTDTVGLADTLAYEWPQLALQWDQLIGQLINKIQINESP